MKCKYACFFVFVLCAKDSLGDTLFFKSGKSYACDVISYSNSLFTVMLNGTKLQAPAANVERIEFATEGEGNTAPAAPLLAAYEFQEDAKYTPATYLEGKTFEDTAIPCTPKEVVEKIYSLENKCLKLKFKRRSAIEQISPTEFTASLYDDSYESVTIYFTTNALRYIRAIREGSSYGETEKAYSLYGIALSPKTLESFQNEYRWRRPVFIPIGRTATKAIGKEGLIYSW